MVKTLLTIHLKNEGQEGKTGPVLGWRTVRGSANREDEGRQIWSMFFV
jgi:hypothetical protein